MTNKRGTVKLFTFSFDSDAPNIISCAPKIFSSASKNLYLVAQVLPNPNFNFEPCIVAKLFTNTHGLILLEKYTTFSDLFNSTNLEYLASTSWEKCCLKFLYKLHSNRKWISFSTLFQEQSWYILRLSGILGRWYLSVSILNLWLLDNNFATAWRCCSDISLLQVEYKFIFW